MIDAVDLKQKLRNTFGKVYLTIEVDLLSHWVHTTWHGYLTEDITKAGSIAYTKAVRDSGFHCVLNDSRQVVGRWDHSLEWALQDWVPMAVDAGIKYFAFITTPGSFSAETTDALTSGITLFEMKIFDNMREAKSWLQQKCLGLGL